MVWSILHPFLVKMHFGHFGQNDSSNQPFQKVLESKPHIFVSKLLWQSYLFLEQTLFGEQVSKRKKRMISTEFHHQRAEKAVSFPTHSDLYRLFLATYLEKGKIRIWSCWQPKLTQVDASLNELWSEFYSLSQHYKVWNIGLLSVDASELFFHCKTFTMFFIFLNS